MGYRTLVGLERSEDVLWEFRRGSFINRALSVVKKLMVGPHANFSSML